MNDNKETMLTYAGAITMILGIWLAVSSLLFGLSAAAFTSVIITALALVLVGAAEMYSRSTWISWLSAVAGVWLIVSPFIFPVADYALWSQVIVGVMAIGLGLWDRSVITSGLKPHLR